MKYRNPQICSKRKFKEYLFKKDINKVIESLLAMALYSDDRVWVKKIVIQQMSNEDLTIRKASIVALSHMVRIDKNISYLELTKILDLVPNKNMLLGEIEDLLDDWKVFNS